jgi:Helix-turn-helix.
MEMPIAVAAAVGVPPKSSMASDFFMERSLGIPKHEVKAITKANANSFIRMPPNNLLSDRIRIALNRARRQPAQLAAACGIKQPSVSGWLSGETKNLRGKNLYNAATFLGVSARWLATGDGPMTGPEAQGGGLDIPLLEKCWLTLERSIRGFQSLSTHARAQMLGTLYEFGRKSGGLALDAAAELIQQEQTKSSPPDHA